MTASSPSSVYAGFVAAFSVMIFVNMVGNSLVISVVLLNKSMKTPINYLLVNLAISDLTVAVFSSIQFIVAPAVEHPDGTKGTMLCKFLTGGNPGWIGAVASVFSLVAVAFERYCAVLHPYSQRLKLNKTKTTVLVILCWALSIIFAIPGFLATAYITETQACGHRWSEPVHAKVYTVGWTILAGVIPISVMGGLYSKVVYRLWFTRDTTTEASQKALLRYRKRATKMVIAVTVVYVLCWVPELTIYFLGFTGSIKLTPVHHGIASALIVFNSSINPVVYSLQSSQFRRHLSDLIHCRLSTNRINPGGVTQTS